MSLSLVFTHCGPYKLILSFTSTSTKQFIGIKHLIVFLILKYAASDKKTTTKHNVYKYIVIKWHCETWYTNLKCNTSKQYSYNIVYLK